MSSAMLFLEFSSHYKMLLILTEHLDGLDIFIIIADTNNRTHERQQQHRYSITKCTWINCTVITWYFQFKIYCDNFSIDIVAKVRQRHPWISINQCCVVWMAMRICQFPSANVISVGRQFTPTSSYLVFIVGFMLLDNLSQVLLGHNFPYIKLF